MTMTRRVAASLACLVFLFGCSQSTSSSETDQSQADAESLAGVPEEQRGYLADGEVSRSEYEAALKNAASCVAEKGWTVERIFDIPQSDRLAMNVQLPEDGESVDVDADVSECLSTHFDQVELTYLQALVPTGAERDEQLKSLVACLHGVGVGTAAVDMDEAAFVKAIVSSLPEEELANGFACLDAHENLFWR